MTDPDCAICLGPSTLRSRHSLECGHVFHATCLRRWFRRGADTCPCCRAPCDADALLSGDVDWCPPAGSPPVGARSAWRRVDGRILRGRA